ncbi:unnamed protein product [Alternaria alternata]
MEPSPLTQDSRPEIFQPKIISLYETLFKEDDEDVELSEGFWQEFFLHRPDTAGLKRTLASIAPDEMLHQQARSQQLFRHALLRVKQAKAPADEIALETLTVFLDAALTKKYTNPSSDIISVLTGLNDADTVMTDFVATLDTAIRGGRDVPLRLRAVRATLSITAAGFQTALPSYFTHRDLFPSLMKYISDCPSTPQVVPALYLLGLLTNYNKFEFQNPYRLRLDDFVNDAIIQDMVSCFGDTCRKLRDSYVAVQDDMPEGWSLGSTLSYIGLGALAGSGSRPTTPTPAAPEEAKSLFAALPGPEIGILLSVYDFANANKVFCFNLVKSTPNASSDAAAASPSPLSAYLSLTSYMFQHAHRSARAALYTYLSLFVLQILVEDQTLAKRLCSEESKLDVRLCRQRQPYLPVVRGERVPGAVMLDMMKLWRTLLSFVRFLTTYESDIKSNYKYNKMIDLLVNLLAFALSSGENFLPDPAAYDDLFYKLVESGDTLVKFRDAFGLTSGKQGSMQTLINVSNHYQALLNDKGKARKHLSPQEVHAVIKQGYETLSIDASEGLDRWDKFREADHKSTLKKIARVVVEDARGLGGE